MMTEGQKEKESLPNPSKEGGTDNSRTKADDSARRAAGKGTADAGAGEKKGEEVDESKATGLAPSPLRRHHPTGRFSDKWQPDGRGELRQHCGIFPTQ